MDQKSAPDTLSRGIIPIFFSSVTNTSKRIAFSLQHKLEEQSFHPTVTNIGDLDYEEFLNLTGSVVFILSTYGNGGSPPDGEVFVDWLRALHGNQILEKLEFSILALGNKSFEHFCGNGRSFKQSLIGLGAKEESEIILCDSSSTDDCAAEKFDDWSNSLIAVLKQKYELKKINFGDLLVKYRVILSEEEPQMWEKDYQSWEKLLNKQFLTYHLAPQAKVIHIKQMRQINDGRSTLWIRLKIPENMALQPACNINVYPRNIRKPGDKKLTGSIRIESSKKNVKLAYPPIELQQFWSLINFSQFADINLLTKALKLSQASNEVKEKYDKYIKDPEQLEKFPIRCSTIVEDLNPGYEFMVELGINTVRPYTLASWQPQKGYFDLIATIDPLGLTSKYFSSRPESIKVMPTRTSFYVPSGRPIVMIANGSGIAPFRSITQNILSSGENPKIYLYFGIQNKNVDFYFKSEWEEYEKKGRIVLRIAESRANPEHKAYVQDLVKEDRQFFRQHLFQNKGVIFICGGSAMAKSVDSELFEAIKLKQHVPFKAFKLSVELTKNKTIVKQVFH